LREHLFEILNKFQDKTPQSECLVFYRPSFGRRNSKANSSVFGEFEAIIASKKNVYLIESKWDNLGEFKNDELMLRKEQTSRHKILSWYLTHWNEEYSDSWYSFAEDYGNDFKKEFKEHEKTIVANSLLAKNLEFFLAESRKRCKGISPDNIKKTYCYSFIVQRTSHQLRPTKASQLFQLTTQTG
jgi:hypothetical protein